MPKIRTKAGEHRTYWLRAVLPMIILGAVSLLAQRVGEYAVKAAFVYDFAKFVTWPPGAFRSDSSPITICVLGENPFGDNLTRMVEGKTFNGRAFTVKGLTNVDGAEHCHILFIGSSERRQIRQILERLGHTGILTVGDTDGLAKEGVMINLFLEEKRVRFEINPAVAAQAGISISSKLLSLARIVKE